MGRFRECANARGECANVLMGSGGCRFFNVLMPRGNEIMAQIDAWERVVLSSNNLTSESNEVDVKRKGFSRRFIR